MKNVVVYLFLIFSLISKSQIVTGGESTLKYLEKKDSISKLENKQADSNQLKYTYCEIVGTQKFLSLKLTISVDYGESLWVDKRIRDEETGKVASFNSMVDGLNYMGENGWEFVQAYVVTYGNQNVYRWLLKKKI